MTTFPNPIEAVVLDMDGLLLDSEVVVHQALVTAAAEFGRDLPLATFKRMVGLTHAHSDKILVEHFGADFALESFHERVRALFQVHGDHVDLKPGVHALLDALDALGLPYALCTSSRRPTVDRHMGAHGLIARFQHLMTGDLVTNGKPHPEPYLAAASALGVSPKNCLALEDSHNGVRSAHAAGMMTVMVPDMLEATAEIRALCLAVARDLHEVRGWVAAHRRRENGMPPRD